ncbi:MAG: aminomethyl-transferring glycine dehydrogenase subunit GcvPA [Eubacteriales bacterium]|nr:aminomethyl-transferring glycine dehydrogenase subunit GcvPA [Eubacteriales bacterium]
MRSYVPNTVQERQAMLEEMGLPNMDALFADIPDDARLLLPLNLPDGLAEADVRRVIASYTSPAGKLPLFRGAGAYRHDIPAVVDAITSRSEFYTAYTPYQAEMSQGMLQAIFEYQTLICQLTGMEVANASVYDGAHACSEAMFSMVGAARKKKVLVSAGLNPQYSRTVMTYARFQNIEVVTVPLNAKGVTDIEAVKAALTGAAGLIMQSPNFYGCIENIQDAANAVHEEKALLTACVNPISLGILKTPGTQDADFCVGEGQPLGIPLSVGGPYLGFMAAKKQYIRNLPGRIVGETTDADGNRAYVLTLQAREQHIRREKAASNICSNQCLCAIAAAVYLTARGPAGMREVAMQNLQKAHYLAEGIQATCGLKLRYPDTPFFNEFTMDCEKDTALVNAIVRKKGYVSGLRLAYYDAADTKGLLFCATEMNTRGEMDGFLDALAAAVKGGK